MKEKWIIGIGGTTMDAVELSYVEATEEEVQQILVDHVFADKSNHEDTYISGTETVDQVILDGFGNYYAVSCFQDTHYDYSAKRLSEMIQEYSKDDSPEMATAVFHVEGYATVEVPDNENEEILMEANEIVGEYDFGALYNIEWQISSITHDDGSRDEYR